MKPVCRLIASQPLDLRDRDRSVTAARIGVSAAPDDSALTRIAMAEAAAVLAAVAAASGTGTPQRRNRPDFFTVRADIPRAAGTETGGGSDPMPAGRPAAGTSAYFSWHSAAICR